MSQKHFEEKIKPIKYEIKHNCKSIVCDSYRREKSKEEHFNEGAKKQLETILEDYVLIPRWKDGKRPN